MSKIHAIPPGTIWARAEEAAREYLLSDYAPPGERAGQPGSALTAAFVGGYIRGHAAKDNVAGSPS